MLARLQTSVAIAGLAVLILVKIAFIAMVFILATMASLFLGCATSSLIDPWNTSNHDSDGQRYLSDHSLALRAGEVKRLQGLDFSDSYWHSQDGPYTVLSRPGAEGSVTFAFYTSGGRDWLFVSPLAFRDVCSPLDMTFVAPWIAHVLLEDGKVLYSDDANREYSWRFGERRARVTP